MSDMITVNRADLELIIETIDLNNYSNSGIDEAGNLSDLQCALMGLQDSCGTLSKLAKLNRVIGLPDTILLANVWIVRKKVSR